MAASKTALLDSPVIIRRNLRTVNPRVIVNALEPRRNRTSRRSTLPREILCNKVPLRRKKIGRLSLQTVDCHIARIILGLTWLQGN